MGTVFFGDVVLDSFNKAYRDENNNVDQIYEKQICSDNSHGDFNSLNENAY